ncbi:MAG: hypothetical protein H6970_01415 [Gammaproteobacteria bacterium]|nr:hypothetical protein [Gammaproteobacteria bacterium]MCP5423717.1 hypothetical protein [Gammaproteobacteria bacterium]MCP5459701.1 hypothetical protein [Gammaproteobacteria bacterium]
MATRSSVVVTLCLAGSTAVLAGIIGYEILHPPQLTLPALSAADKNPAPADTTIGEPVAAFAAPPLEEYADIVERPLFLESRRPPDPSQEETVEAGPATGAANDELTFLLQGVMLTPRSMMALLRIEQQNKVLRLRMGDTFDDWHVDAIRADGVSLRAGDRVVDVPLIRNKPVPKKPHPQRGGGRRATGAKQAEPPDKTPRRPPPGRNMRPEAQEKNSPNASDDARNQQPDETVNPDHVEETAQQ